VEREIGKRNKSSLKKSSRQAIGNREDSIRKK
jgi:hypothetical protein